MVKQILNLGLGIAYWLMVSKGGLGRHTIENGGPVTPENLVAFFKVRATRISSREYPC